MDVVEAVVPNEGCFVIVRFLEVTIEGVFIFLLKGLLIDDEISLLVRWWW